MKVFCLIPVFNRLESTIGVIKHLMVQSHVHPSIIIVDDGSTDNTAAHLRKFYPTVKVLQGNGDLWWGGSMDWAVREALKEASDDDFILFQNNDTSFAPDYLHTLVLASLAHDHAVVGSPLTAEIGGQIFSLGPKIDYLKSKITDLIDTTHVQKDKLPKDGIIEMEALSGRGTLYPAKVLRKIKGLRPKLLPHYWADYEVSIRAKTTGARTILALAAPVTTGTEVSGINVQKSSLVDRCFSRKSRSNILDTLIFFSMTGPYLYRFTAVPRIFLLKAFAVVRAARSRKMKTLSLGNS